MSLPAGPYTIDGLLFQANHLVLPWMAERITGMEGRALASPQFPASSIGVLGVDAGGRARILGGVAYSFWYDCPGGGDCQVSVVMEPGARVTRRMWRHLYGHGFVTMRCRRMSMQTRKNNRPARLHAVRMGWTLEGMRREADEGHDLVLYGLLRRNLRNGLPPMKITAKGSVCHG